MSKASIFARFSCAEGKADEMEVALEAVVAASESLDGVESYSYHRGDDGTYWFYGLMASTEAMETHNASEAMQTAMQAFMPLLAAPPEISMTTPIAIKGVEL